MSQLLARIMLALLMLPLAAVLYGGTAAIIFELAGRNDVVPFVVADLVAAAFVGLYWCALWRRTVKWTRNRIDLTVGSVIGAVFFGVLAGALGATLEAGFGVFIGGVVTILVWLTLSVLVWRETTEERLARIRSRSADTIGCPSCGYNMTGLTVTTCPECGATFSLDELLAAQPEHEQAEIEGDDSSTA